LSILQNIENSNSSAENNNNNIINNKSSIDNVFVLPRCGKYALAKFVSSYLVLNKTGDNNDEQICFFYLRIYF
jgi:hypothetical protein